MSRLFDRALFVAMLGAVFACLTTCDRASTETGGVEAIGGCSPRTSVPQTLDAATVAVGSTCSWLEGITPGGTIVTICAVADELLQIATFVISLLPQHAADAGPCTAIPTTDVCASKDELGKAILEIIARRRARLARDGGEIP